MPAASAPNAASTVLERVLAAAKERELAVPTQAAYRRTWLKLVAWSTAAGLDLATLPREKALAYYEDLTENRSASHHLQVKAGIAFLYKVLDKKSPFTDCLAPRFRPEALEIHFLEAGDIGKVLLSMRNELGGDYFGRLASHLAEALFFTACRFHEWALLSTDRLVRNGAGEFTTARLNIRELQELLGHRSLATTARYTHIDRERLKSVVAEPVTILCSLGYQRSLATMNLEVDVYLNI